MVCTEGNGIGFGVVYVFPTFFSLQSVYVQFNLVDIHKKQSSYSARNVDQT